MSLSSLGWSAALAQHLSFLQQTSPLLFPGRIVRQESHWLRIASDQGELLARPSGRLEQATEQLGLPVIGDWVALHKPSAPGERALIEHVFPRKSLLARRARDDGREGQAIAANADAVLAVVGLDREPNVRWLERALTLVWDSGARPVAVLNKADLCDSEQVLRELKPVLLGAELVAVSAQTGQGLDALWAQLQPGQTAALLGASGVGKSSLVNRLLGESALATGAVRERDHKGRHTTTHRELRVLPNGALLIDGPGMRELGLWDSSDGVGAVFPEINALGERCRFRDCTHEREPGCAVQHALETGTLDAERFESYAKLRREQRWLESTATAQGRAELHRKQRVLSRAAYEGVAAKRRS